MPDKARKSKQVRQLHVLEQDGTRSILNVVMHGNTTVLRGIPCNQTVSTTLLYVRIFIEKGIESYKLYVYNTWVITALNYRYHTIDAREKLQSLTQ